MYVRVLCAITLSEKYPSVFDEAIFLCFSHTAHSISECPLTCMYCCFQDLSIWTLMHHLQFLQGCQTSSLPLLATPLQALYVFCVHDSTYIQHPHHQKHNTHQHRSQAPIVASSGWPTSPLQMLCWIPHQSTGSSSPVAWAQEHLLTMALPWRCLPALPSMQTCACLYAQDLHCWLRQDA